MVLQNQLLGPLDGLHLVARDGLAEAWARPVSPRRRSPLGSADFERNNDLEVFAKAMKKLRRCTTQIT
jgi:hypothetical protein